MISDDDLLLYYYRDGLDASKRARVGTALAEQPELAQRLHRLVAQLDTAAETAEVPVPDHVQQRWQAALDRAAHINERAARPVAGRRSRSFTALPWQLAAAAVVILAVLVTVQVSLQTPQQPSAEVAAPTGSAYERGLRWHLASTEQRLARLDSAQPDERAQLIETIIEQNRMYALAAERANEPHLARVLRAFTPILQSLTDERREASASDIAQLSFELRVMQARLQAETDTSPTAQQIAL